MKVGWLHDDPGYLGGAELTMREFKAAAPEGVEFVDEAPDTWVFGNVTNFRTDAGPRAIQYHHDMQHSPMLGVEHVFCSPEQRDRMGIDGLCIPPAIDLASFKAVANQNHRKGAVCVGRMAYGKGLELLAEYDEPVDVFSSVPVPSKGNARYCGATEDVAATLAKYERFVFLPTAFEPFGRSVVEAWAAGCELVINRNVGARYWIEENPEALETAREDFWRVVLHG